MSDNDTVQEPITCPHCGSTRWTCYDEQSRDCWDQKGHSVGTRVIGALKCDDCGKGWLDYSVDPAIDEPDCECEEY